MKHLKIAGTSLKYLLAVGLLTACNHDEPVNPAQNSTTEISDQNAKISYLTRLVKNGQQNIQYIKSGKFFGRVSKISSYYGSSLSYMEFTYDDNNPNGDLWISQKLFVNGGILQYEWKHKVVNGLCVESLNLTDGTFSENKYTPDGYLDEIKNYSSQGGAHTGTIDYSYGFNVAANTYRLAKVTYSTPAQGPTIEYSFTYTGIPNKYPLAISNNGELRDLPIYGKSSDVLVDQITHHYFFANASIHKKKFSYTTDADGLVTSMTTALSKDNGAPYSTETRPLKFSESWQGI